MKKELLEARNKLYEALPTGKVDAFELTQAINIHLKRLDNIIDTLDTKCVLSDVVGQSEQLCQHDRSVTNRICDDCGSKITYVPDDKLA